MIKTVNLISGGGSTNLKVLEAQKPGGVLHGLVETVAIVSSDPDAAGIQKALDFGFPEYDIRVASRKKGNVEDQLLNILGEYSPDFFAQFGWLPHTPRCVIERYQGLNQHLGPGGRYMIGERRIFTHMRFCQFIGEMRPIPIFCQLVHPDYDEGDVVYVRFEEFSFAESWAQIARRLLPIEHKVQIEALRLLATGQADPVPVPRVYNPEVPGEEDLMKRARLEAEVYYANLEGKTVDPRVLAELETLQAAAP